MPVNIHGLPGELGQHVVAERCLGHACETRHGIQALDAECLHRGPGIAAHHGGRVEPGDAVHQVGPQQ